MTKFGSARIERKKFWDRMRIYGYISGGILVVVLLLYVFFGSPLFKINEVKVISATEIDTAAIIKAVKQQVASQSGLLGPDSYFAWSTSNTYAAPNASTIEVEKSIFSHTITLRVEPRQRFAVWCKNGTENDATDKCFWVDQTGLLFEPAPQSDGQLLQTMYDDAPDAQFVLGQQILEAKSFDAVTKIFKSDILKHIGIGSIRLSRSLQELTATTISGTKLIFSIRFDPELSALPALAKFIADPGLSKLQYVNLTVENRAFVKYK